MANHKPHTLHNRAPLLPFSHLYIEAHPSRLLCLDVIRYLRPAHARRGGNLGDSAFALDEGASFSVAVVFAEQVHVLGVAIHLHAESNNTPALGKHLVQ